MENGLGDFWCYVSYVHLSFEKLHIHHGGFYLPQQVFQLAKQKVSKV